MAGRKKLQTPDPRTSEERLDEAQDLISDAWDAPDRRTALKLARKALRISPDCADAYSLLAQEARTRDQELELYRKGVEADERALGKDAFKRDVGHFWAILETRPDMRACTGLAECRWYNPRSEAKQQQRTNAGHGSSNQSAFRKHRAGW